MERNTRSKHVWNAGRFSWDLSRRGLIMGILNVTPDSFSDGGRFKHIDTAVAHGLKMFQEGAAILDIGGESTRPGAKAVSLQEELDRVIPVVEKLHLEVGAALSIDTTKPAVAEAALSAGADIVNDISGFRNPAMIEVCARSQCGLVAMHMQGTPQTMQDSPKYQDVLDEVADFFQACLRQLQQAGISEERVLFDPGIGFGKSLEHNLSILRGLKDLMPDGRPLLMGLSRKSFIGRVLNDSSMDRRAWPTIALTAYTRAGGALVHRVHDVKENHEALRLAEAL